MSAIDYSPAPQKITGLAKIKVGTKKAKLTFLGDKIKFSKVFPLNEFPDTPKLNKNTENTYFVVYNPDENEIESVGPEKGIFKARCVDLSRPEEGSEPEPIEGKPYTNKDGKETPNRYFAAIFKFLSGDYVGNTIPAFIGYKVKRRYDGMTTWTSDPFDPKATAVRKMYDFLDVTGALDGDEYSWDENDGNILPEVYVRILNEKRDVDLVIKSGKISEMVASQNYEEDDNEKVDDENLDKDLDDDSLDDELDVEKDFPKDEEELEDDDEFVEDEDL